jgi:hypothetical protein
MKYRCLACQRIWNEDQLIGEWSLITRPCCGDYFCGGNVVKLAGTDNSASPEAQKKTEEQN